MFVVLCSGSRQIDIAKGDGEGEVVLSVVQFAL